MEYSDSVLIAMSLVIMVWVVWGLVEYLNLLWYFWFDKEGYTAIAPKLAPNLYSKMIGPYDCAEMMLLLYFLVSVSFIPAVWPLALLAGFLYILAVGGRFIVRHIRSRYVKHINFNTED